MGVRKVVFSFEDIFKPNANIGNIDKINLIIQKDSEKPILIVESGDVKVADKSLPINCKEILDKIGKIDFEKKYDVNNPSEYVKSKWELIIDDKKYEGMLEDPYYIVLIKKIIRFNAIEIYANKKISGYFGKWFLLKVQAKKLF